MIKHMSASPVHRLQMEIFLVRIWRETSGTAWRGEILHIPDQTSRHFASLDQAQEFIQGFLPGLDFTCRPDGESEGL
jgi:hypothetical protein